MGRIGPTRRIPHTAPGGRLLSARNAALAVGLLAALHVVAYAVIDRSPVFGGAETADLSALMFHHYGLRGWLGRSFGEVLTMHAYKPPLWYGGVPLLFAWKPTLDHSTLLLTNALALALACKAAWTFGRMAGGPRTGLWCVLALVGLPGVAGRFTVVGVEPWHLALLGFSFVGLLRLHREGAGRSHAVATGTVMGMALLMKWTFAFCIAAPLAWEALRAWRGGDRRRFGLVVLTGAVAAAWLAVWLVGLGDLSSLVQGATMAPSSPDLLSWNALSFLPDFTLREGLGLAALPAALLAMILGRRGSRGDSMRADAAGFTAALLSAVLLLLFVHTLIPHKEEKYMTAGFWPLAMLIGLGLSRLDAGGGLRRKAAMLAVLWLLGITYAGPRVAKLIAEPPGWPSTEPLQVVPDADDYGLDALVKHPSLRRGDGPSVVLFSLVCHRQSEILTLLNWELYGRNQNPVLSLASHDRIRGPKVAPLLDQATHLLTSRSLEDDERQELERRGFEQVADTTLRLVPPREAGLYRFRLYARGEPPQ